MRIGKDRKLGQDLGSITTRLWESHNGRHDIINNRLGSLERTVDYLVKELARLKSETYSNSAN